MNFKSRNAEKALNIRKLTSKSLSLLDRKDRNKVYSLTIAQFLVSFMDAMGLISLGVLVSLGISYTQGDALSYNFNSVFNFFNLDEMNTEFQMLFFGVSAVLLLSCRTLISLFLSKKTFLFLGRKSAQISSELMLNNFKNNFTNLRRQSAESLAFGLTEGINFLVTGVISSTVALVTEIGLLLLILALLSLINLKMALFALLFFAFVGLAIYFNINVRISKISSLKSKSIVDGNKQISEIYNLYREIHVTKSWEYFEARFLRNRLEASRLFGIQSWLLQIPRMSVEIAIIVGGASLALVSIIGSNFKEALPDIVMFIAATSRLAPSVLRIQQSAVAIRGFAGAASDSLDYERKSNNVANIEVVSFPEEMSTVEPHHFTLNIENVSFKFDDAIDFLIKGADLKLNSGEIIALVGTSGAGKSTLCDLILGIQTPTQGKITSAGYPMSTLIESKPGFVAYLPQDVYLLESSIIENVAFGLSPAEVDTERVRKVLNDSGLPEFSNYVPGTDIPQEFMKLQVSGGQRQRIGLARALYNNPSILILDEPTSALDSDTEDIVMQNLQQNKRSRITIIVAHRDATIKAADRVITLKDGRLISS
jgi:ATP-binding cassette subfamily C protein